jgi:RNA recognition motif-containing protein
MVIVVEQQRNAKKFLKLKIVVAVLPKGKNVKTRRKTTQKQGESDGGVRRQRSCRSEIKHNANTHTHTHVYIYTHTYRLIRGERELAKRLDFYCHVASWR